MADENDWAKDRAITWGQVKAAMERMSVRDDELIMLFVEDADEPWFPNMGHLTSVEITETSNGEPVTKDRVYFQCTIDARRTQPHHFVPESQRSHNASND